MAKIKTKTFDSLTLAIIRRATNRIATTRDWKKLQRAGAGVQFADGRWVVTLPAIDALAAWNRSHRKEMHTQYLPDIGIATDGEVHA